MSTLTTDDFIKFIITYLKDESKIQESKMNEVKIELFRFQNPGKSRTLCWKKGFFYTKNS